jgi:Mg/Co/Ni transporter MgtE
MDARRLSKLLSARDFAAVDAALAAASIDELAQAWPDLLPMDQLVAFKLLDAPRGLELYSAVAFKDKYFLLCGFPLQSIAPVLEGLSPEDRRRFVQLPRDFYDKMFRRLVSERVDIAMPMRPN